MSEEKYPVDFEIYRDAVIGYVVVERRDEHANRYVETVPIVGSWEDGYSMDSEDGCDLNEGDKKIAAFPAPPGTYLISTDDHNRGIVPIGTEYLGATPTDWVMVAKEKRESW